MGSKTNLRVAAPPHHRGDVRVGRRDSGQGRGRDSEGDRRFDVAHGFLCQTRIGTAEGRRGLRHRGCLARHL